MRDSEVLVTHHKALMELSHNTSFIAVSYTHLTLPTIPYV